MPIAQTDEGMPDWGWVKELLYEQILMTGNNELVLIEWAFYADSIPCPHCRSTAYTWIQTPPHNYGGGIWFACSQCRMAMGPLDFEGFGRKTSEEKITKEKAYEICKRTGQTMPTRKLRDEMRRMRLGKQQAAKRRRPIPKRKGE